MVPRHRRAVSLTTEQKLATFRSDVMKLARMLVESKRVSTPRATEEIALHDWLVKLGAVTRVARHGVCMNEVTYAMVKYEERRGVCGDGIKTRAIEGEAGAARTYRAPRRGE